MFIAVFVIQQLIIFLVNYNKVFMKKILIYLLTWFIWYDMVLAVLLCFFCSCQQQSQGYRFPIQLYSNDIGQRMQTIPLLMLNQILIHNNK